MQHTSHSPPAFSKNTRLRRCSSFFSQLRGLMFRQPQPLLMIFKKERQISLHTWFVFFPLDIALLDSKGVIKDIHLNMQPFRLWRPRTKGKYILELPSPEGNNLTLGKKLVFS